MADLFTLEELASYLQRDLDTATAVIAQKSAQAAVRRYCRRDFTSTAYTDSLLPIEASGDSYVVRLPQRPVTAVTSVAVNGTAYVDGVTYSWDGRSPRIRLSTITDSGDAFPAEPRATVTYTAGYASIPDDVKGVALAAAGRVYDNPRGLRSESIDDYSATRAGADADLAGVSLLDGERALLDPFRVRAGSIPVR